MPWRTSWTSCPSRSSCADTAAASDACGCGGAPSRGHSASRGRSGGWPKRREHGEVADVRGSHRPTTRHNHERHARRPTTPTPRPPRHAPTARATRHTPDRAQSAALVRFIHSADLRPVELPEGDEAAFQRLIERTVADPDVSGLLRRHERLRGCPHRRRVLGRAPVGLLRPGCDRYRQRRRPGPTGAHGPTDRASRERHHRGPPRGHRAAAHRRGAAGGATHLQAVPGPERVTTTRSRGAPSPRSPARRAWGTSSNSRCSRSPTSVTSTPTSTSRSAASGRTAVAAVA